MSSPTSSASSTVGVPDDPVQSTKERRRERNRLAAQKHRLRRSQRMTQLEQQVLALQQEKHALLTRWNRAPTAHEGEHLHVPVRLSSPERKRQKTAPSDAMSVPPDDSQYDSDGDDYSIHNPNHLTDPQSHSNHLTDPHPNQPHSDPRIPLLESRILELERWTEDLTGSLRDAHDSEARLKSEFHAQMKRAENDRERYDESVRGFVRERNECRVEIVELRRRIAERENEGGKRNGHGYNHPYANTRRGGSGSSGRTSSDDDYDPPYSHSHHTHTHSHPHHHAHSASIEAEVRALNRSLRDFRNDNVHLKETLEGCEVALELQRRDNVRLRERVGQLEGTEGRKEIYSP